MSEYRSERNEMTDTAQAGLLVRNVIPSDGRSVKARIRATATRLNWSFSRTKAVWYEEARVILANEMDRLRAAQQHKEAVQLEGARHEYRQLRDRLARMEAYLTHVDPAFHSESIDAVREQGGGPRNLDLSGD